MNMQICVGHLKPFKEEFLLLKSKTSVPVSLLENEADIQENSNLYVKSCEVVINGFALLVAFYLGN